MITQLHIKQKIFIYIFWYSSPDDRTNMKCRLEIGRLTNKLDMIMYLGVVFNNLVMNMNSHTLQTFNLSTFNILHLTINTITLNFCYSTNLLFCWVICSYWTEVIDFYDPFVSWTVKVSVKHLICACSVDFRYSNSKNLFLILQMLRFRDWTICFSWISREVVSLDKNQYEETPI